MTQPFPTCGDPDCPCETAAPSELESVDRTAALRGMVTGYYSPARARHEGSADYDEAAVWLDALLTTLEQDEWLMTQPLGYVSWLLRDSQHS